MSDTPVSEMGEARPAVVPRATSRDLGFTTLGQTVLYTDRNGRSRAAIVEFLLDDGDRAFRGSRPVLRVLVPQRHAALETSGRMPDEGAEAPCGSRDFDVYAPKFDAAGSPNTWRQLTEDPPRALPAPVTLPKDDPKPVQRTTRATA